MSKRNNLLTRNVRRMTHPEEQTEEQARRAPLVLAITLGILVLIAALTWGVRLLMPAPEPTPAVTTQSATDAPAHDETDGAPSQDTEGTESEPATSQGCAAGTNRDVSQDPPETSRWVLVADVRVPEVPGALPCRTADGNAAGFQRTMTGALVAAYNYAAVGGNSASEKQARAFVKHGVIEGPMQAAMSKHLDDVLSGVTPPAAASSKEFEVRGYQIVSYSEDQAYITLLFTRISDQRSVAVTEKLVWQDSDWKVDPAGDSAWASTVVDPPEAGFQLWGSGES